MDETRARLPRGVTAAVLSLLLSVTGGGGTAWLVAETKMAWLRADVTRLEQKLAERERRDETAIAFQATILERVDAVRGDLALLRAENASVRARLEGLRWGR